MCRGIRSQAACRGKLRYAEDGSDQCEGDDDPRQSQPFRCGQPKASGEQHHRRDQDEQRPDRSLDIEGPRTPARCSEGPVELHRRLSSGKRVPKAGRQGDELQDNQGQHGGSQSKRDPCERAHPGLWSPGEISADGDRAEAEQHLQEGERPAPPTASARISKPAVSLKSVLACMRPTPEAKLHVFAPWTRTTAGKQS